MFITSIVQLLYVSNTVYFQLATTVMDYSPTNIYLYIGLPEEKVYTQNGLTPSKVCEDISQNSFMVNQFIDQ